MLMRLQVRLLDPAFSSISSDAACISVHLILVKKDIAFAWKFVHLGFFHVSYFDQISFRNQYHE